MWVIILIVVCLSNILCYALGAITVQKAKRGEELRFPDPVKKAKEIKETREQKREQEAIDTMLYNIDAYDGTSMGQKEIRG